MYNFYSISLIRTWLLHLFLYIHDFHYILVVLLTGMIILSNYHIAQLMSPMVLGETTWYF